MKSERADVLLVKKGLVETRERAQRIIMAGCAYQDEKKIHKSGEKIPVTALLRIKTNALPYVSRGGLKLAKAFTAFAINISEKIFLDIGSSTGGFTDCALQNGAKLVYALDVGTNQLVWKLRIDPRVVVMEKTNFRYSKRGDFNYGAPEVVAVDVSFISLRHILPNLREIIASGGECICLVKPQFEAGKGQVGKNGIVRDEKIHQEVLQSIADFSLDSGYDIINLTYSPIKGGKGNIEYLLHLRWNEKSVIKKGACFWQGDYESIIAEAREQSK